MSWPIATARQVRALDEHTIVGLGVPAMVLMETAARAVAIELLRRFSGDAARGVLVVAGRGNNAGDGYAVARLLHLAGTPVRVLALPGPMSPDCALNRRAAAGVGVPIAEDGEVRGAVLVDALFGTGLDREIDGLAAERIRAINAAKVTVVSVDMPSGICTDTGAVLGVAVRAALTVTFDRARMGQLLEPGVDHCGELVLADIGLRGAVPSEAEARDGADIAEMLPARAAGSHKGDHGHLAVVAGSPDRAGAAVLLCRAAMRSGCGLVTLFAARDTLPRLAALPPEVMVRVEESIFPALFERFDALAVGPGVGLEPERLAMMRALWSDVRCSAVFDADGLTALALSPKPSRFERCITPHTGEAARLLSGFNVIDRVGAARGLSRLAPALLKGRHTLIAAPDAPLVINRTGTAALATAGAGDVLTGLVGALLARGLAPRDALIAGAFVHGYAGELAGEAPILAGDVAEKLPKALRTVAERGPVFTRRALL